MSLNIRDDDRRVQETLNRLHRLQARVDDLEPVIRDVAGHLKESTDEAIATQTAPDGSTWEPLAESTIVDRLRRAPGGSSPRRQGSRAVVLRGFRRRARRHHLEQARAHSGAGRWVARFRVTSPRTTSPPTAARARLAHASRRRTGVPGSRR